ncbi:acyl-CoA thioesterase [Jannaschia sp. LMIT008]|uniref:acyl-CoA thioesterase n=1 Tax=Jannaschia maritima TaxID=3032585 RepID=UPI0028117CD8|nr:acyl-CoA thioesterase [Jannaschia sp. LMIT008]
MYPFVRLAWQLLRHRGDPPMDLTDVHVSRHLCLPWDLDGFGEMNNGRILTLMDLGRFTAGTRIGLLTTLRREGWGLAVAGGSVRYRRRITAFARIEMRTRTVGWDARFVYIVQEMWVRGECACQAVLRTAVTGDRRAVPTDRVLAALGRTAPAPVLPDWVAAWAEADALRPWPPVATRDASEP